MILNDAKLRTAGPDATQGKESSSMGCTKTCAADGLQAESAMGRAGYGGMGQCNHYEGQMHWTHHATCSHEQ